MIDEFVIVRTDRAGVHCGFFVSANCQNVLLRESRRIHRWNGAMTLNELSLRGSSLENVTRISEPVEKIMLLDGIEVIPCTELAKDNLRQSRWL